MANRADGDTTSVMVVDDSATVRTLLQRIIEAEPGFKVIATARDGQLAVERCKELKPDIVTLDVEMPNMSGLEALPRLLEAHRSVAVLMCSSLTSRGAKETVEALLHGALDYITKPAGTGSYEESMSQFRTAIVPKLKALASRKRSIAALAPPSLARPASSSVDKAGSLRTAERVSSPPKESSVRTPERTSLRPTRRTRVLALGSSTGGPVALSEMLQGLPASFPLPIVIAQHMPEIFTRLLAERLSDVSKFKVREAVAGEVLRAGEAWIAPGNFHMTVETNTSQQLCIGINSGTPVNSCRPSIDVLFESIAKCCGGDVICALLTGMGHDGRDGAKAIRQAGGQVLAQDEASSVVWGIPGAVVSAGLASGVYPLKQLPDQIMARLQYASVNVRSGV